jgi:hypothetical protein
MNEPNIIPTESDKQLYGDDSDNLKRLKTGAKKVGFKVEQVAEKKRYKMKIDSEFIDLPEAKSTVKNKQIDTEMTR